MRKIGMLSLYTALALGANATIAQDLAALDASRAGDMTRLLVHPAPTAGSDVAFLGDNDAEMTLAAYDGQYVVLNFWATWCAPCLVEMPHLSALQDAVGGDDLQVVTIATGRNPPPTMARVFDDLGVTNLPLYRDPNSALAQDMGVFGLPVTVILDREGREIARLQGDAHWADENALAVMQVLLDN